MFCRRQVLLIDYWLSAIMAARSTRALCTHIHEHCFVTSLLGDRECDTDPFIMLPMYHRFEMPARAFCSDVPFVNINIL